MADALFCCFVATAILMESSASALAEGAACLIVTRALHGAQRTARPA